MNKSESMGVLVIFLITAITLIFNATVVLAWMNDIVKIEFYPSDDVQDYYNFTMTSEVSNELARLFDSTDKEYLVCMSGVAKTNFISDDIDNYIRKVVINRIDKVIYSNYTTTVSGVCDSIFVLHKHPSRNCDESSADIRFFKQQVERHGTLFNLVQCQKNKFGVYSYENYVKRMNYES